jgi:nucleoside-diphosphate-sugar epimerase
VLSKHFVISGATGFLGKELIKVLQSYYIPKENLSLISTKESKIRIGQQELRTSSFNSFDILSKIDVYFDFAFLSREKILTLGPDKYYSENLNVINHSVDLINKYRPKNVVLSSSGVVHKSNLSTSNNNKIYAELKLMQEKMISDACSRNHLNLITARIFNLSGEIDKVEVFALSEFVNYAKKNLTIQIKSKNMVTRRYCDTNQLLRLLLKLSEQNISQVFDTGGAKIEIRDLAKKVIFLLNSNAKIICDPIDDSQTVDNYFSNSSKFEMLVMKVLEEIPLDLDKQIMLTAKILNN